MRFSGKVAIVTGGAGGVGRALVRRAPLFLAQAALPHMRRRCGGSVINIGSIEGLAANPGHTAYCASKAGVHGTTRAMAVDLGADGIRATPSRPGGSPPS